MKLVIYMVNSILHVIVQLYRYRSDLDLHTNTYIHDLFQKPFSSH